MKMIWDISICDGKENHENDWDISICDGKKNSLKGLCVVGVFNPRGLTGQSATTLH